MAKIIITIETDENGKVIDVKHEERRVETEDTFSQYARFFDETCPNWTRDAESNLIFLKATQLYLNDKLKRQGYVFLNDAYDAIGIPRTKEGQLVGWVYNEKNPTGDNCVDFGLTDPSSKKFVNGYERTILLDFNVDGNILESIE